MSRLILKRAHNEPDLEAAKSRIHRLMEDMKPTLDKHVKRIEWNGPGTEARLSGRHVNGSFSVDNEHFVVDLKLSLAARLVRHKIESRLDDALKQG